ncbi:hypothetical protein L6452_38795 [Arctium lappa]|uniref:Uncharacterized protein n=1 Tax=Arctium lappa TaxID=4217 RepID=A0ACB8XRP7_ARCLA|nr:hypothetical protein L6452_38795 [Arctium lappa]
MRREKKDEKNEEKENEDNKCFDCGKRSHYARDYQAKKVKDYEYYSKKSQLVKAKETRKALRAEEEIWHESPSDEEEAHFTQVNYSLMAKVDEANTESDERDDAYSKIKQLDDLNFKEDRLSTLKLLTSNRKDTHFYNPKMGLGLPEIDVLKKAPKNLYNFDKMGEYPMFIPPIAETVVKSEWLITDKECKIEDSDFKNESDSIGTPIYDETDLNSALKKIFELEEHVSDLKYFDNQDNSRYVDTPTTSAEIFLETREAQVMDMPEVTNEYDDLNTQTDIQLLPNTHRWTKAHPPQNIIGDPTRVVKTRSASENYCLYVNFLNNIEPKNPSEALQHPYWIKAMQDEL